MPEFLVQHQQRLAAAAFDYCEVSPRHAGDFLFPFCHLLKDLRFRSPRPTVTPPFEPY
jgi:hypothetical protein